MLSWRQICIVTDLRAKDTKLSMNLRREDLAKKIGGKEKKTQNIRRIEGEKERVTRREITSKWEIEAKDRMRVKWPLHTLVGQSIISIETVRSSSLERHWKKRRMVQHKFVRTCFLGRKKLHRSLRPYYLTITTHATNVTFCRNRPSLDGFN